MTRGPEQNQPIHPESTVEEPLLMVKYNEPFAFPMPSFKHANNSFSAEDSAKIRQGIIGNSFITNIEVEGHPGFPFYGIGRFNIYERQTRTKFKGFIQFKENQSIVFNPFERITNRLVDQNYFFPFGPIHTELSLGSVKDNKGPLVLNVRNLPITLNIVLFDLWESSEGNEPTRVFIIHNNKAIEGLPYRYDKQNYGKGGYFFIDDTSWINGTSDQERPVVTNFPERMDSILMLPSDPEFFRTAQILIGDKPPQLHS